MLKYLKKPVSLLLSFIMLFSLATPILGATDANQNKLQVSTVVGNVYQNSKDTPIETKQDKRLLEEIMEAEDMVRSKSPGSMTNEDLTTMNKIKPKDRIARIRKEFTPLMLEITAYFYPNLFELLNPEQKKEIQSWNKDLVNRKIAALTAAQLQLMSQYAPIATEQYDYHTNRDTYQTKHPVLYDKEKEEAYELEFKKSLQQFKEQQDKKKTTPTVPKSSSTVTALSVDDYKITPFKNEYNYSVNTDDLVDPLYQTANQKKMDLSLSGKEGLGFSIIRRYNSLEGNLLEAQYRKPYPDTGSYAQMKGNIGSAISRYDTKGFIATGWTINIPRMQRTDITAEVTPGTNLTACYTGSYQGSGNCYKTIYYLGLINTYEKVSFVLEDGTSIEFRNGVPFNYPYQNVSYSKTYNNATSTDDYKLVINGTITYIFDNQGQILSKTNQYGNQVTYVYHPLSSDGTNIVVTDSFGRTITIYRNNHYAITGFKVEDGATLIKQIQYSVTQSMSNVTYRTWTSSNGATNLTENLYYWQLNDVKDITNAGNPQTMESYDYYAVDSTKLADFNMRAHYYFDYSGPNGEIVPYASNQQYNYWSDYWGWKNSNNILDQPVEIYQINSENQSAYGEIPYLLLQNVHYFNGMTAKFIYQNYNTGWYQSSTLSDQEQTRGSTRLFQDKYALQYISYHKVLRVDYTYTENGTANVRSDYYWNTHNDHGWQWNEYWKTNRAAITRLGNSSRFGDKQMVEVGTDEDTSSTTNRIYYRQQYQNNGIDFVRTASWNNTSYTNIYIPIPDDSLRYRRNEEITIYEYDSNQMNPKKINHMPYDENSLLGSAITTRFIALADIPSANIKLTTAYTYDNWGKVLSQTDELGNQTNYEFSGPFHQISKKTIQAQDASVTLTDTYVYYASNDPDVNKRNQLNQATRTQQYFNPTTSSQNSDSILTSYPAYTADKQVQQSTETGTGNQFSTAPSVTKQDYTYTSRGQVQTLSTTVTQETNQPAVALTLTYSYDPSGRRIQTTYPDGSSVTNGAYDAFGRISSQTFQPVGATSRVTSVQYVDSQRKVTLIQPDQVKEESSYTPFGQLLQSTQYVKDSSNNYQSRVTLQNIVTSSGRIKETRPFGNSSFATAYGYTAHNEINQITPPLVGATISSYMNGATNYATGVNTLQKTVASQSPDGLKTISYYDTYGRLSKVVEQTPGQTKLRTITNTYNSMGQVKQKTVTSGSTTQTTQYGYDGFGNLIYLKDNTGQQYQYVYNRMGEVLIEKNNGNIQKQKTYNEAGWMLTNTNAAGEQEKFTYTNTGSVTTYTDKAGQKTVYSYTPYHEADRTSIQNPAGTEIYWQQHTYDPITRLLTGVSSSENETLTYQYDMWKRNNSKVVAGKTYGFEYDAYDRSTSIIYPDNQKATYAFDALNRITTVNYLDVNGATLMSPVTYNYGISSNVNTYTETFANGLKQEKQTDAFKELTAVNHYNNSITSNWTETFGYDGFGNISTLNRNNTSSSFGYDGLNRIQQENVPSGQNRYTYDDRGNRLTLESVNLPSNIDGTRQFTYNALNQLKTFTNNAGTTAAYSYYGDGLRATKTVNGQLTRYVYVNGKIIEELDASGNSKARNIWGNELLFRQNSTAADSQGGYYFFNGHGDVVKVTDNSGNILNSYDYDIWGNVTAKTETMNNPFKYTGEMQDDETGYIYLRARYYDPSIGRFINEDTYEGKIDNPLSLNRYTYVSNNPLIYRDPTGFWAQSITENWMINDQKKLWSAANDNNDISGMENAAKAANELRQRMRNNGAKEIDIMQSSDTFIPEDVVLIHAKVELNKVFLWKVMKVVASFWAPDPDSIPIGTLKGPNIKSGGNLLPSVTSTASTKINTVLDHIKLKNGAPPPGYVGGSTYQNKSQALPTKDTYKEYDINPKIPGVNRGQERIVISSNKNVWYTNDHYQNFIQIK